MNGMGRGPYRTLGAVVDACDRDNPFVRAAVDAATQFLEDEIQKKLDEYLVLGIKEIPVSVMSRAVTDSRGLLYRYLQREVPRDNQEPRGGR